MENQDSKIFNIGITCIGSGVGQSIIDSLKLSNLPFRSIGFGTNPFAFGAYDCTTYDYTPSIYSPDYIDKLIEKCVWHKIDLLIPGLDDEVLLYAENEDKLKKNGIRAIYSKFDMVRICRDKEAMSEELNKLENVFVKSYDKLMLNEDISSGRLVFPFIAKPRGGFASRGVEIIRNFDDVSRIKEYHIIQELAIPKTNDPNFKYYMDQISKNVNPQVSEISIQLVFSENRKLLGRMMSYNKLNNGIPIEVVPYHNEQVWEVVDRITPILLDMGLKGPINIQGRLTNNGLKIFEMNPRFTGITGLRALMGFNEVEACVKEWLGIDIGLNILSLNRNRFGIRQTKDRTISIERNSNVRKLSDEVNANEITNKKNLLISGSTGSLGTALIRKLIDENIFNIWAFGRKKEKLIELFGKDEIQIFDRSDLENGHLRLGNVDILLHLAFSRPHCDNNEIAQSFKFTQELFTRANMHQVPSIINISSQSVYGLNTAPPWTERSPVFPASSYSMAKYASEELLKSLKKINNQLHFTSVRLGTISGVYDGLNGLDFLSKIAKKIFLGETIDVIGGTQEMERIDIRDAVEGLSILLKSDSSKWEPVYNLGSGEVKSLISIVNKAIKIGSQFNGKIESKINIINEPVVSRIGLDSSLFSNQFSWKRRYGIENSIISLMEQFQEKKIENGF